VWLEGATEWGEQMPKPTNQHWRRESAFPAHNADTLSLLSGSAGQAVAALAQAEPKFGSLQEGERVAELLCRLLQNLQHVGDPKNSDIWPRRVFKLPPFACTGARCGCRC